MWWGRVSGKAAYYVAIEAATDTAQLQSRPTSVTTVQTND